MKTKLEQILDVSVQLESWQTDQLQLNAKIHDFQSIEKHKMITLYNDLYICIEKNADTLKWLKIEGKELTLAEKKLVEFLIATFSSTLSQVNHQKGTYQEAHRFEKLSNWIKEQIELGKQEAEIPNSMILDYSFQLPLIPILVFNQHSGKQSVTEMELKKLLDTFFDESIIVFSLSVVEWMILLPEKMISSDVDQKREEPEDTIEQKLSEIAAGIHDILWTEGIAECHLAIHYPMIPSSQLLSTIWELKKTLHVGKSFHHGQYIHIPWTLHIEKLLYDISEKEKLTFIHEILDFKEQDWDDEIMMTVDEFLSSNCHVSHTAKKLFIHRNTLLYRLEKFKQISGLDVRDFEHAVLVKLALLLYKMTK
jgi:sugar diacid utilization regulator